MTGNGKVLRSLGVYSLIVNGWLTMPKRLCFLYLFDYARRTSLMEERSLGRTLLSLVQYFLCMFQGSTVVKVSAVSSACWPQDTEVDQADASGCPKI